MAPWHMQLQVRSRMRIAEDWHSRLGVCRMGLEEGSVLYMFSLGLYELYSKLLEGGLYRGLYRGLL